MRLDLTQSTGIKYQRAARGIRGDGS